MQSARCCIVILLRHGLAQKNLHAGDPDNDAATGSIEVNCFAAEKDSLARPAGRVKRP
jgi:hypothetical protein